MHRFSVSKLIALVLILAAALSLCSAQAKTPGFSITFDKDSYAAGETITVQYKIDFTGKYSKLEAQWGVVTDWKNGDSQWAGGNTRRLDSLEGEFSFTPGYGEGAMVQINLWDENGQWHILESKPVRVKNEPAAKPECSFSFDKDAYTVGEKVTVHYVIDFGGRYSKIEAQWGVVTDWKSGNSQWDGSNTRKLSALEGDISFSPQYGEGVAVQINLWDENGQWHMLESKPVRLNVPAGPLTEYRDKATVKAVQEALNAAGYPCGTPDGVAGKKTAAALSDYQSDNSLTVTGTVTRETLEHMGLAD